MEVHLHSFLTLALDGVECFTRQFSPIRNWIGPIICPEVLEKKTFPFRSSSLVTTLTELSWHPIGQGDKHVFFYVLHPGIKTLFISFLRLSFLTTSWRLKVRSVLAFLIGHGGGHRGYSLGLSTW